MDGISGSNSIEELFFLLKYNVKCNKNLFRFRLYQILWSGIRRFLKILSAVNLGLRASWLAWDRQLFNRYRLITGKTSVKTCRTKVFNLSWSIIRWQKLGPWNSWIAWINDFCRYRQLLYFFTGKYFLNSCWTKYVLMIKIYDIWYQK